MIVADGATVPDHCLPGKNVLVYSAQKDIQQVGTVISVGEHVCVIRIRRGPEIVARWEAITPAP